MSEIKKVWVVTDYTDPQFWTDPALMTPQGTLNYEELSFQILDPAGMSIARLARLIQGTPGNKWEEENSKVYSDYASASKDARARLLKLLARMPKTATYDYSR